MNNDIFHFCGIGFDSLPFRPMHPANAIMVKINECPSICTGFKIVTLMVRAEGERLFDAALVFVDARQNDRVISGCNRRCFSHGIAGLVSDIIILVLLELLTVKHHTGNQR